VKTRPDEQDRGTVFPVMVGAILIVAAWGGSFAVTRVAVREMGPLMLALARFILASLVLWPVVRRRAGGMRVLREDRRAFVLLGLTGVTIYFAFENVGLVFTSASHGALIVATIPLVTALAEGVRLRRRPRAPVMAGFAVALAGVALVVGDGLSAGDASLIGDFLMFGAVAAWTGYTFLVRRLSARYDGLVVTQGAMLTGTATLIPLALIETVFIPPRWPSAGAWGAVIFLGLICSALAYLVWNRAIVRLGVTVTGSLLYGIPLAGVQGDAV
jgi:drug/metabolite transporter (DMT)-like permease